MVDKGIGDYFISDTDDESYDDDDLLGAPVVVPVTPQPAQPAPAAAAAPAAQPQRQQAPAAPAAPSAPQPTPTQAARPQAQARQMSREEQLAQALDELMREDGDIQAAALVSLDGFTMASALPASSRRWKCSAVPYDEHLCDKRRSVV